MLRRSGIAWTFLRNSIYTEMVLPGAPAALESGKLVTNAGDGLTAYVGRADCAAAAAAVLTQEGHDFKEYDITGGEAVSQADLAAILSEIGGRPVEPDHVDDDAWVATMVEDADMTEKAARIYATFGTATRQGFMAVTSTTVEDLTGRPPKTAREVLDAHRDELAGIAA